MPTNSYKDAGVNVQKGNDLVDWLKEEKDKKIHGGEIISGIGGFAGLFKPDLRGFSEPLLVAGTDGVGTKLMLGLENDRLEGLGVDLVAMCVNDLYTIGARPLFFLDYYATGMLDDTQFKKILTGIRDGLRQCGAAMLGGETAEMPGLYDKGHFDLAGFVVGIVEASKRLQSEMVKSGDVLVGLPSDGFHSNGYSLVRKWLKDHPTSPEQLEKLLVPTKIYSELPDLVGNYFGKIHGISHITGGGISENLARVIPDGCQCVLEQKKIPTPEWMLEFFAQNRSDFFDVENVFNMGIGMILAVDKNSVDEVLGALKEKGTHGHVVGSVVNAPANGKKVEYR